MDNKENKLRVGIVTSSCLLRTGFSNNAKALIPYLWKTNKYDIYQLNQGLGDDPNFMRFPWKNEGAFRPGTFDQNRMNSNDENYKRTVSYGNLAVESFIQRNKIEVLLLIEDFWAYLPEYYFKSKWWPYLKDNVFIHGTADSIPILPLIKEWAENCGNVHFWTTFGVKKLHEENKEKYGHVGHTFGSFNINEYFPIEENKRLELRRKLGIDDDTKIFLTLDRNQLRKIYPASIEAFSTFKKKYPQYKAKLHFHCFWSEPNGWPLERLRNDFGLNKEDILCTYTCRQCRSWFLEPYITEETDCPNCKTQKSRITAGVTSSITNEEINLIQNIADASVSITTSGGFEYFCAQSCLVGKPLLCSNYSSGEDFCAQDFVFPSNGSFSYEVGTGFKKFSPNLNEMVNFYKTICEISKEKLEEIKQKSVKWSRESFDINVIGPKFEKWLDSRKRIDWDYKYLPEKPKNPHASISNNPNNFEWVKELYSKILNVEPKDDDEGLRSWIVRLEAGRPREEIYKFFVDTAHSDNSKIQKPFDPSDLFDKTGRKTILLVAPESIGDIIYIKGLLPSIKKQYPIEDIYFACKKEYAELLEGDRNIYKIIEYQGFMDSEIYMTGQGSHKGFVDHYIFIPVLTQKYLSYLTNNNIALDLIEK